MKNLVLLLVVCLSFFACGDGKAKKETGKTVKPDRDCVEVLCFHAKQRCVTCLAIEEGAKEVVESEFADELKNGDVVFKVIDISLDENKDLVKQYEVAWSSLLLVKWKDGKSTVKNLTVSAFANAWVAPEKFKNGLKEDIKKLMD